MARLSPIPFFRELDGNGRIMPGFLIYTYDAGTDTPKATFTDHTGDVPNSNPIVADGDGRLAIWLGSGNYKLICTDGSNATIFDPNTIEGVTLWSADYIAGSMIGAGDTLSVRNLGELRAVTGYAADQIIFVQGHTTQNDGGGGWFYFKGDSTEVDDDGINILPDDLPVTGRWIRLVYGEINARWYGAGIDGVDTEQALQTAMSYAIDNDNNLFIPEGTYPVFYTINVEGPTKIHGEKGTLLTKYTNNDQAFFTFDTIPGIDVCDLTFQNTAAISAVSCTNIVLQNIVIDSMNQVINSPVLLKGCTTVDIHDNIIKNAVNGIEVTSSDTTSEGTFSSNVNIHDNTIYQTYYNHSYNTASGVSLKYCVSAKVSKNTIRDINHGANSYDNNRRGYCVLDNGGIDTLQINGNEFTNTTTRGRWTAISISDAEICTISDNTISNTGTVSDTPYGVYSTLYGGGSLQIANNALVGTGIYYTLDTDCGVIKVNDNNITYAPTFAINFASGATNGQVHISGNIIQKCSTYAIYINNVEDVVIDGNNIIDAGATHAITYNNAYRSSITNNTCNTTTVSPTNTYMANFGEMGYKSRFVYSGNTGNVAFAPYKYSVAPYGYLWQIGDEVRGDTYGDQRTPSWTMIAKTSVVSDHSMAAGASTIVWDITEYDWYVEPGMYIGIPEAGGVYTWATITNVVKGSTTYTVYLNASAVGTIASGSTYLLTKWRDTISPHISLYVKGVGSTGTRMVTLNGRTILSGNGGSTSYATGLWMTTYDQDTMEVEASRNYDIAYNATDATAFKTDLLALPYTKIATIASAGHFASAIDEELRLTARRCGLSKLAGLDTGSSYSYAYCAVFTGSKFGSTSKTNRSALEAVEDGSFRSSYITTEVFQGGFAGSSATDTIQSVDPTTTNVIAQGAGNTLYLYGRILQKFGTTVSATTNTSISTDGNIFYVNPASMTDYTITRINGTGWEDGSIITLILDDTNVGNKATIECTTRSNSSGSYLPIIRNMLYVNDSPPQPALSCCAVQLIKLTLDGVGVWATLSIFQY